nr:potassium channel subfamily K member 2-like [Lytechinus pictus]
MATAELTANSDVQGDTEPEQTISPSPPSSSSVIKKWLRCFILLAVILTYLFVGAFVFRAMERPLAVQAHEDFQAALHQFELQNDCLCEEDVDELLNIVMMALREGAYVGGDRYANLMIGGIINETSFARMWSYKPNFILVTSVVTTVGFGYTTPRTDRGQFFCVIYAIMGIPFLGTIIWSVGKILQSFAQPVIKISKRLHISVVTRSCFWTPWVFFFNLLLAYILLMVPSSVIHYHTQKDWSWLQCMYFAMVTMTTIGFGDIEVENHPGGAEPVRFFIQSGHFVLLITCVAILSIMFNNVSKAERQGVEDISSRILNLKLKRRLQHHRKATRDGETSIQGGSSE